jgi:hypothetical protein
MRVHRFFNIPAFSFSRRQASAFFAPRKPRHRMLRAVFALVGIALLAVLLVFGLFIGAAMLTARLLSRLWRQRGKPIAKPTQTLDGEYRVLRKPILSTGR